MPLSSKIQRDVHLLRTGLDVLRKYRPALAVVLEPWADNLPELATRVTRIETVLQEVRQGGLVDDGPAWTLKGGTPAEIAKNLLPVLKREMERDHGLG